MPAALLDSDTFSFADGSGGHVCDLGGAPAAGDLDLLCVNSNTVVSTPSGFTVGESRVGNQGAYIFHRIAAGSETSTVTVTTSGNHNTEVVWSRWDGTDVFDSTGHGDAGADSSSGTATPQLTTGALTGAGELVVAFGALHSTGSANQTSPVWTAAYTALTTAAQGSGATGVRGFVAYRVNGGAAAEVINLSWSGDGCFNRYMLAVAFTAAADTPITGALAGTLPAVTAAVTGTSPTRAGALTATLPTLTGALAGEVTNPGALTATLPAFAAAIAGGVSTSGALAGVLPAMTAALVGTGGGHTTPRIAAGTTARPAAGETERP